MSTASSTSKSSRSAGSPQKREIAQKSLCQWDPLFLGDSWYVCVCSGGSKIVHRVGNPRPAKDLSHGVPMGNVGDSSKGSS